MNKIYDCIIIGAGPAGVSAAIYLKRAGIDFLIFENQLVGGKVNLTSEIDNYPPFKNINGFDLSMQYLNDLKHNEIKINQEEIIELTNKENIFYLKSKKNEYSAKTVLVCTGTRNKYLNFKNEEKYINKGISTCAICDGNLFKNQPMAVVGGGNSSLEEALYLANIAEKVYLIHRRNEFRGSKQYVDLVKNNSKIEILTPYEIVEGFGEDKLHSLSIINKEDNSLKNIEVEALFEYVGLIPNSDFILINNIKDKNGFIEVNNNMESKQKGLFAAGDIVSDSFKQIIVASGDAAKASQSIINYLHFN